MPSSAALATLVLEFGSVVIVVLIIFFISEKGIVAVFGDENQFVRRLGIGSGLGLSAPASSWPRD